MTRFPAMNAVAAASAALMLGLASLPAAAVKPVSWNDIANDDKTGQDVLNYGLGLKTQRHSPLKQINARNVDQLVPAWSFSFGGEKQRGQEAQALVHDGVIYVTSSYSRIHALDAKTGKQLWMYEHRLPDDIRPCCDVVNRGAAIYGDKVFFGTLDARMIALDRATGKVVWNEKFADHKVGYTMTGAPTVVKEKNGRVLLVHGSSGDEFGVVGYLYARDPDTGEEVWARPLVEGHTGRLNGKDSTATGDAKAPSWPRDKDGNLVEAWHHGGGAPWQSAAFDPETNTIVIGAGNPAPWNTWKRTKEGDDPKNWDSLFTSGQAYVDATTGELKGFYQHTPNDAWDFSGNNSVVLFDYKDPKTGKQVKASAHADRNGFFYVNDAKTGKLVNAFPFVKKITWATGYNLETGRPNYIEEGRPGDPTAGADGKKGKVVFSAPSFLGGKNQQQMGYSPQTGLFYVPANEWSMDIWNEPVAYKKGAAYLGAGFTIKAIHDDYIGVLRAMDPATGKIVWENKNYAPLWGGVLSTGGGLVFYGTPEGLLKALDAKTGKELWSFQTGTGIVAPPVTWEQDGEQMIAVVTGWGGAVPLWGGDVAKRVNFLEQGGSVWVFKLHKGS